MRSKPVNEENDRVSYRWQAQSIGLAFDCLK
jgi:hypothetical protein